MKPIYLLAALAGLLILAPGWCMAEMAIERVTPERAKTLGLQVKSAAASTDVVRVTVEFDAKGEMKNFGRATLEVVDGKKSMLLVAIREEKTTAGHVVVSFDADRSQIDKLLLMIEVPAGLRDNEGYQLRIADFVAPAKIG